MVVKETLKQFDRQQFLRFIVVGVINTAFSYAVYAAMLFIGLSYALANFVAMVIGIFFSFRTQGRFVFFNNDQRLLGRFIVLWGFVYSANVAAIWLLMKLFNLNAYLAGALTLPLTTVLSYVGQRFFVFRASGEQGDVRA